MSEHTNRSAGLRGGKIYLVGAGPGDPELLTVKAVKILARCDVVLYDRLVSKEILALIHPAAERLYVGKHQGEQQKVQQEIFKLLIEHASQGKCVVRLKGGDPMIFGRGGEEWLTGVRHGVAVELVPGISSAIAVPGAAGIPITYRHLSQSFAVITGHSVEDENFNWQALAAIDTLVVLMGVKNRVALAKKLIAAGKRAEEPCAFIERAMSPQERTLVTSLAEIASGRTAVVNPAVLVVGDVVGIRDQILTAADRIPAGPPRNE